VFPFKEDFACFEVQLCGLGQPVRILKATSAVVTLKSVGDDPLLSLRTTPGCQAHWPHERGLNEDSLPIDETELMGRLQAMVPRLDGLDDVVFLVEYDMAAVHDALLSRHLALKSKQDMLPEILPRPEVGTPSGDVPKAGPD